MGWRLEAIAGRLEAIARPSLVGCMEAIASRLEAIGSRALRGHR